MRCKKCGSTDINIQAVTETKTKRKGLFYWLVLVWFDLIIWLMFFLPRFLYGLIKGKKIVSRTHQLAICQNCGNSWKV